MCLFFKLKVKDIFLNFIEIGRYWLFILTFQREERGIIMVQLSRKILLRQIVINNIHDCYVRHCLHHPHTVRFSGYTIFTVGIIERE